MNDIYTNVPLPNSAAEPCCRARPSHPFYNVRNVFNDTQEFARIDQAFGTKVNIFYRYLHDSLPSTEAGGLFVGGGLPGVQTTNTTAPGTQHLGHVTIAVRPTMLVDMGYAYSSGAVISDPVGLANLADREQDNADSTRAALRLYAWGRSVDLFLRSQARRPASPTQASTATTTATTTASGT